MPKGLVPYQECRALHFITFSCYRRRPFLAGNNGYSTFEIRWPNSEMETFPAASADRYVNLKEEAPDRKRKQPVHGSPKTRGTGFFSLDT
jgi:hypothetical protein